MDESFIRNGALISEADWHAHIAKLRDITRPIAVGYHERMKESIIAAHKKRIPQEPFGVLLSGGVDSSFIAFILKQLGATFTCFSVGIEGSKDLNAATYAVQTMDLAHEYVTLTLDQVEDVLFRAVHILKDPHPVKVGVAAVELAAIDLGKKHGVSTFFGGLGTEEIYAGYQRHELAADVTEECWRGLAAMWERDLLRDTTIASHEKVTFITPFLDDDVIVVSMGIDGSKKISNDEKKIVLREVAESMGLAKDVAFRKKSAAQYGSGIDKALGKLAKRENMSKRDYLAYLLKFTTLPDKTTTNSRGQN